MKIRASVRKICTKC
nr:truncated Rpl36 [Australopyrum retrofractum]